ncbi:MAG: hypothetical protein M1819_007371 [Sarea resinae]|nr:MAG: hypothetical protein M1819_007371 [Sarea resinae]
MSASNSTKDLDTAISKGASPVRDSTAPSKHPAKSLIPSPKVQNELSCGHLSRRSDLRKHSYKCSLANCGKQFSYAGGLSRHEREVHKKNDGRDLLMCPFLGCKRSSVGFSRKENYNEHIRRVHRKAQDGSLPSEVAGHPQKRKRASSGSPSAGEPEITKNLQTEMKRLRKGEEALEDRIRKLEFAISNFAREGRGRENYRASSSFP